MAFFRITLHRSAIGLPERTRGALAALGLRRDAALRRHDHEGQGARARRGGGEEDERRGAESRAHARQGVLRRKGREEGGHGARRAEVALIFWRKG